MSQSQKRAAGVFHDYATFYDALYADKDYEAEVDFLEAIFAEHGLSSTARVLDLGSGTGSHDIPLSLRGYDVTGVDRSPEMVAIAREKAAALGASARFTVGDVRNVRIGRTVDAVISMFAVMGYQLTNEDLEAALTTARAHLEPGGLFIFDGWFGPGVLSDPPRVVTKTVVGADGRSIKRTATPLLDAVAETVSVTYEVAVVSGERVEHTREVHVMRFLFAQELALLLNLAGFDLEAFAPFMDMSRPATESDWNFSAIALAV